VENPGRENTTLSREKPPVGRNRSNRNKKRHFLHRIIDSDLRGDSINHRAYHKHEESGKIWFWGGKKTGKATTLILFQEEIVGGQMSSAERPYMGSSAKIHCHPAGA